ncbi:MAG: hypothetical protein ACFE9R_12785, partial [Candidatus Hermodarchaeota archaeon]
IPHFGCGRFEEALRVAAEYDNVYFDLAGFQLLYKNFPHSTLSHKRLSHDILSKFGDIFSSHLIKPSQN